MAPEAAEQDGRPRKMPRWDKSPESMTEDELLDLVERIHAEFDKRKLRGRGESGFKRPAKGNSEAASSGGKKGSDKFGFVSNPGEENAGSDEFGGVGDAGGENKGIGEFGGVSNPGEENEGRDELGAVNKNDSSGEFGGVAESRFSGEDRKFAAKYCSRLIGGRPVKHQKQLKTDGEMMEKILESKEITMQMMEGVLNKIEWPQNDARFGAMHERFSLGIVNDHAKGMSLSRQTTGQHKGFCKLVNRFFGDTAPPSAKKFGYSAVELTKNLETVMHQDKNNRGPSWTISLGNFRTGAHCGYGALWVRDSSYWNPTSHVSA
jgi:hypothetical protein